MKPGNLKRVAIYARVSTDKQDARSLDDQIRRCEEFAATKGWEVVDRFRDEAASGATLHREQLQILLAQTRSPTGSPFNAVLVDDLSRLSRDLGNAWRIIFEDLPAVNVEVIDVMTGMPSTGQGARLTFGAQALVNDFFLQLVRAETHRGLEGRALAGFSTGGRVYGYSTEIEPNPPDPMHPRKIIIINDSEAAVVRRIFGMYRDGLGLKNIASVLNEEQIRAPYDGGAGNKVHGRGWSHTTVRAMLRNERYIGTFIWNQRKFVRAPGAKNRKAIRRPPEEWKRTERLDLAIIDRELWDAVQVRFRTGPGPKNDRTGRPPGTGRRVYLLGGILKCATCGGSFSVTGQHQKNGTRFVNFGCMTHHNRGAAICPNNLHVSERKVTEAVLSCLTKTLKQPDLVESFLKGVASSFAKLQKEAARSPASDLAREIARAEERVKNVTAAIARLGLDSDLEAQLVEEKARLQALRTKQVSATDETTRLKVLPHPRVFRRFLDDLMSILTKDAAKGRAILARYIGTITMTTVGEGRTRHYHAAGAFNLSLCLNAETPEPCGSGVSGKTSCGGRI